MENTENKNNNVLVEEEFNLEKILSTVMAVPNVRVDRNKFLAETFSNNPEAISQIIEEGPIEFGIPKEELRKLSKNVILGETSKTALLSFLAGIPSGLALFATIPADVIQFYGVTLRLAQKLAYLYGTKDLWEDGKLDDENVKNSFIIYCGVMFGAAGAENVVRVLSSNFAKIALKKIPQRAYRDCIRHPGFP